MKKENFGETLNRFLLEKKPLRLAIEAAAKANPEGYQRYVRQIFDVSAWKEDKDESK